MRWLHALVAVLVLSACAATTSAPTPQTVVQALTAAGLTIDNVQEGRTSGAAPQSYTAHADFTVNGKGGQLFICDTKKNCDAIYAYYDALKALAGPYTYQSDGGTGVVQLNSQLSPDVGTAAEKAIKGL